MKSNDIHTDEIIKCFHCGNETPMKKVGEYSWGSRDIEESEFPQVITFYNKSLQYITKYMCFRNFLVAFLTAVYYHITPIRGKIRGNFYKHCIAGTNKPYNESMSQTVA